MADAAWKWLETSEYGGQDGSVLTKLFKGKENLTSEELLAREVIQNSWDAARVHQVKHPGTHFGMVFRFVSLTGADKSEFVRVAGLDSLKRRRDAIPDDSELDDETALRNLDDPSAELRILYLEDYGSHGLFGDPEKLKSKSHLFKALYLVGGTGKTGEDAAQGGSFGFGKSAFVRASGTNTVIAHSAFEALDDDPVTRRLVGWTWWPGHRLEDEDYEGRAIFGQHVQEHVVPYVDASAGALAQQLGLPVRDETDPGLLGTTFLLVDPVVDPEKLREAVEVHWWPALEDHLIDVRIIDYDGSTLVPRPSKQPWLVPYIEAYRIATQVSQIVDSDKQRRPSDRWQKTRGIEPGALGLVVSDVEVPEDRTGPCVALVRSPRMVIDYKPFLRKSLPIYGTFVASSDEDPLLRLTEPPAHDLWDIKEHADTPSDATAAARTAYERIRRAVMEFADEFQPPPPQDGQRLTLMAQLLSSFLRNKPIPPPAEIEPISIQFHRPERAVMVEDGLIAIEAGIRIGVTDSFKGEGMDIAVTCPVVISEDEGGRGERWPAKLAQSSAADGFTQHEDGSWRGFLDKDTTLEFDLRSDPFDADWTAIVNPRVERLTTAAGES